MHLDLALRAGQIDQILQQRVLGHIDEKIVHIFHADHAKHLLAVSVGEGEISHGFSAP